MYDIVCVKKFCKYSLKIREYKKNNVLLHLQ